MIFRASMVGDLMSTAKSIDPKFITDEVAAIQNKTKAKRTADEQKLLDDLLWSTLPDGAITILDKLISQKLINWQDAELDYYTLEKGIRCENESIELYNEVHDTFYIKNVERVAKEVPSGLIIDHDTGIIFDTSQPCLVGLTGECDLLDTKESLVIDIKTAYSKKTYPLRLKMSKLYEWQLRAYMHLYDVNQAELAYCLVDTPADLITQKDPEHWHIMSDVPLKYRVSTLRIERDLEKEQQLLNRLQICSQYVEEALTNG